MWISIIIIIIVSARSARGRGRGFLTRYFNTSPSPVRPEQCTMDIPVTFLYPKKAGKKGFLSLPRGFCKNIKIQRREWKSVTSVISLFGISNYRKALILRSYPIMDPLKMSVVQCLGVRRKWSEACGWCWQRHHHHRHHHHHHHHTHIHQPCHTPSPGTLFYSCHPAILHQPVEL